jgi:hypothetical protein
MGKVTLICSNLQPDESCETEYQLLWEAKSNLCPNSYCHNDAWFCPTANFYGGGRHFDRVECPESENLLFVECGEQEPRAMLNGYRGLPQVVVPEPQFLPSTKERNHAFSTIYSISYHILFDVVGNWYLKSCTDFLFQIST